MSTNNLSSLVLPTESPFPVDERVLFRDIGWAGYEALLALRGETRRPRMTYFQGAVELMSISLQHETIRFLFGRLLEAYMLELGVAFCNYGQTTFRILHQAGFEADESYVLSPLRKLRKNSPARPDLVLEVVFTNGGEHKLDVYRALEVPEVWLWHRGVIRALALTGGGYELVPRSRLLPRVDLGLIAAFMERAGENEEIDSDTMLAFREALRGS